MVAPSHCFAVAAEGDVLRNAHHVRQGSVSGSRRYAGDLHVPSLQDRAARPDLRFLRSTEDQVTRRAMGVSWGGTHHGLRVVGRDYVFTNVGCHIGLVSV